VFLQGIADWRGVSPNRRPALACTQPHFSSASIRRSRSETYSRLSPSLLACAPGGPSATPTPAGLDCTAGADAKARLARGKLLRNVITSSSDDEKQCPCWQRMSTSRMTLPRVIVAARSTQFSSSRTLPGQLQRLNNSTASGAIFSLRLFSRLWRLLEK